MSDFMCGDLADFKKALALALEIEQALQEGAESGWFDQPWEHLGDAERDIRVLIAGLKDADDAMASMVPIEMA